MNCGKCKELIELMEKLLVAIEIDGQDGQWGLAKETLEEMEHVVKIGLEGEHHP